jgi:hypothetical protein
MAYIRLTNFAAKDALITGNPSKVVRGTEIGAEFDSLVIEDALNLKTGGALGTPASGTLTNCTGLPVAGGGTGSATAAAAKIALNVVTAATGSIVAPVGTTAQRDVSPSAGYVRYNTTTATFEGYGSAWGSIGGGATGAGGDAVFQENAMIVTTSYTLTTAKSASSVGPITILGGISVTVGAGQRWIIL